MKKLLTFLPALLVSCSVGGDATDFDDVCFGKCDGMSLELESGPATFKWGELQTLSNLRGQRRASRYALTGAPAGLEDKLNRLLDTPFVDNHAFRDGLRPYRPSRESIGPVVRVLGWNIERGQQYDAIVDAFRGWEAFAPHIRPDWAADDMTMRTVEDQVHALEGVDVLVLSEVDRGMKRSGYHDVVADLAKELGMNWAFATEFVEVDPMALGTEVITRDDFATVDATTDQIVGDGELEGEDLDETVAEANQEIAVDHDKLMALHGNAVLSRYPILSARAIPLQTTCWDWNGGEWKGRQLVQGVWDWFDAKVFLEKTMRQVRHGGRTALVVDLYVPGVNARGTTLEYVPGVPERQDIVTVVSTHLESNSSPGCRQDQMQELLGKLAGIQNPIVLSGDLNTFGSDGRPETVQHMILSRFGNWQWVSRKVLTHFVPYSGWAMTVLDVVNIFRLKDDPTGVNIPIFLPNPERGLFDAVERQQFADWARFDFRGDTTRTVNGTKKTLANSNQRDTKGFKTTQALERTLGLFGVSLVGRWKIDWIFVKGYARSPRDSKASYRMAPHFPQTLEELRDAAEPRLSDHAPMLVDLPIDDQCKDGECAGDPAGDLEFGDTTWLEANATND